jgi:hypothetical protein
MTSGTREDLTGALTRHGRLHGWNVTPIRLGYYTLRFTRADGTIGVRIGAADRIAEVTVDIGRDHYQLSLPARTRLEELLAAPVKAL